MFTLSFDTQNAAFDGGGFSEECERILRAAARKIAEGNTLGILCDSNGNVVGKFRMTGIR